MATLNSRQLLLEQSSPEFLTRIAGDGTGTLPPRGNGWDELNLRQRASPRLTLPVPGISFHRSSRPGTSREFCSEETAASVVSSFGSAGRTMFR